MDYDYQFRKYNESDNVDMVTIPILSGMQWSGYYFLAGGKVGIGVFGDYYSSSKVTTYAVDKELIDNLTEMPNHLLSTKKEKGHGKFGVNPYFAAAAEFGVTLDEWMPKSMLLISVGRKKTEVNYR